MSVHEDYFEQPCGYTFNEVAKLQEESRLVGRREVVEWLDKNCACFSPNPEKNGEYIMPGWRAKLKEWGIKEE